MIILALDPGPVETAWVEYDTEARKPCDYGHEANAKVLERVLLAGPYRQLLAVEMIASYGMAVGKSVFETCLWIGRYIQAWHTRGPEYDPENVDTEPLRLVYRIEEKMHLCKSPKANDSNIRQAIMDRYGSTKEAAVGTKKNPGPLYGVSGDVWAALAVAIVAAETEPKKEGA